MAANVDNTGAPDTYYSRHDVGELSQNSLLLFNISRNLE